METRRAVVIGAGWAGEGHTVALRNAGVDVVALCGRTPDTTRDRAASLGVQAVYLDWKAALTELKPDIVAIATPGNTHSEMALTAAEMGIHILCEKPLGINAEEARCMLQAVKQANVKHAYGSTSQYDPSFLFSHQLIADGRIGNLWQAEYISHWQLPKRIPHSWVHELTLGGGFLNNVFTHHLGQVQRVTGGRVISSTGVVTGYFGLTPVTAPVHDFRDLFGRELKDEEIIEWRKADADSASLVVVKIEMPDGGQVHVLFQGSSQSIGNIPGYLAFYGTHGTLRIVFGDPNKIILCTPEAPDGQELPIPQNWIEHVPAGSGEVQRDWNTLVREFVAHINGAEYPGYPTFEDGWVANEVIDSVRAASGWWQRPAM